MRVAVTGGTSGLGLALVRRAPTARCARGFRCADAEHVEDVARRIAARTESSATSRSKEDIYPIALQIVGNLGGLDVLINNASSLGPTPLALLADTDCEDFELALATNVLGPFRLTKALLGALTASAREGGEASCSTSRATPPSTLSAMGRVRREQGRAASYEPHLERGACRPKAFGCFPSIPGDMDTPLHALAVPDADPATLKRPETAARELADAIARPACRGERLRRRSRRFRRHAYDCCRPARSTAA